MPKGKAGYYAVASGREPGVYKSWDSAKRRRTATPTTSTSASTRRPRPTRTWPATTAAPARPETPPLRE
ncbi:hypothetical protein PF008_g2137 [Phytophthora fragariae]|uniref:Ribonuclease H1 N-terminal domain-containing protein n=1 Tax=Phytophthora fragariae TaxID=53985 RepID=A0A6G0SIL6_9STRA|nr:hypothetical protein PF008_g2137 [Phytophthora fragariae]